MRILVLAALAAFVHAGASAQAQVVSNTPNTVRLAEGAPRPAATVADVVKSAVRTTDFAVRYGGEEMAILLTHTDADGAAIFAERLRQRVAATPLADEQGNRLRQVTVSVGVAVMQGDTEPASLLARCDGALYASKRAGRNRVTLAPAPGSGGEVPAIDLHDTHSAGEKA